MMGDSRAALLLLVCVGCSSKSSAVKFDRDYTRPGTWTYAYRQALKMTANSAADLESVGTMTLVSNQDRTATLTVDASLTARRAGEPDQQMPRQQLTMLMAEDGTSTGTGQDSASMAVVGMLFPVPQRPIKVGDSETQTITIPAEGLAGKRAVSGPLKLTFVGYQQVAGVRCAQLDGALRIEETDESDSVRLDVAGAYCLDPKDASLITAKVTLDIAITSDADAMKLAGTLTLDRE